MSISRIGTGTASATTVTVPAHQAGDLIIIFAFRAGSTTAPSLPSGFISILTKSGTTCSARIGYKWASSTSDTSGTWTNASIIDCHVYRASSGNVMGVGKSASASSTTLTVNFPVLTPLADNFSGNSWVAGFVGVNNATQVCTVAPSGMTNESTLVGADSIAGFDTNGGVTTWASTNATDTGTAGDSVSCAVELMLLPISVQPPNIVQHIGGGSYPPSAGATMSNGNLFNLPIMSAVGTGNCIVLGLTYPNGLTVTVSDNINGAWGAAAVHANAGSGNMDSAIYTFPNSLAGQMTVMVAFSAGVNAFQYSLTEFYNIDGSPSAGSTSAANTAGPTAAAGSFTPTNNDSTGGNIIWSYVGESSTSPSTICTGIRAGQNMVLLDADIGWVNADGLFHASSAYVQTTHGAINPTFAMIGDTDKFNTLAIALKINNGQGTAPASGIRLCRVCHFTTDHFPTSGVYSLQSPVIGNCRVVATDDPNISASTAITDNEGNTYTAATTAQGSGIFYCANTQSNSNLQVIINGGGADNRLSWRFYDVIGAATAPFDNAQNVNQTVSAETSFTQSPSPTPTFAPGLCIANVGLGQGPGIGITAPSGAVFDLCTYGGSNTFNQTSTNNFVANDTMQVGNNTFTFVSAIGSTAGNVLIGANFAASVSNLAAAIMAGAGLGTLYITPTNAPNITAFAFTASITFIGSVANNNLAAGYPSVYTAAGTAAGTFAGTSPFGTETDFDYIEDADLSAHYNYSTTAAQTWTWAITNVASNSTSGGFILLKAASGSFLSLSGCSGAVAKGNVSMAGAGAFSARGVAKATGRPSLSGVAAFVAAGKAKASGAAAASGIGALLAGGQAQARGSGALSGIGALVAHGIASARAGAVPRLGNLLALIARGAANATGRTAPFGNAAITAAGVSEAKGWAGIIGVGALLARGEAEATGRAGAAGKAALAALGASQAKGAAAAAGIINLAARAVAMAKGAGPLTSAILVGLIARGAAMAKGRLALSGTVALAGSGAAQAKGSAVPAGIARLTARAVAAARGAGVLGSSIFVALLAHGAAMARARTAFSGATAVSAAGAAQARGMAGIAGAVAVTARGTSVAVGRAVVGTFSNFVALFARGMAMARGALGLNPKVIPAQTFVGRADAGNFAGRADAGSFIGRE
jgi:hypothetical protein